MPPAVRRDRLVRREVEGEDVLNLAGVDQRELGSSDRSSSLAWISPAFVTSLNKITVRLRSGKACSNIGWEQIGQQKNISSAAAVRWSCVGSGLYGKPGCVGVTMCIICAVASVHRVLAYLELENQRRDGTHPLFTRKKQGLLFPRCRRRFGGSQG